MLSYTPGGIPKIIFKTSHYKKSEIPNEMMNALRRVQEVNQGYSIFYFDDNDVESFMKDFSLEVYKIYKKLKPGAYKADFFRVCVLYKYGGCYSDIGHVPLVSFDDICEDANLILVDDTLQQQKELYIGVHNALMCSTPLQPYFKMCIDAISERIQRRHYGENWFDITGPTVMGKVFNCYFHKVCDDVNRKLLKPGTHVYDDCKVKILNLNMGYIDDVILTKFDNYHKVMYGKQNRIRYNQLWDDRQVYN
jgi:mannosyltransferase OCH1-like enzyme